MSDKPTGAKPNGTLGGLRTRHVTLGVSLPIQAAIVGVMHTVCGSGLFDNPITYTSIVTTIIGVADYLRNSGKN